MTEQQACTLCGAGGHTAAQCNWNKATSAEIARVEESFGEIGHDGWRKIGKPAMVGAVSFGVGISSRLVVEAAQRHYEYSQDPAVEAERMQRISNFVASVREEHPEQAEGAQGAREACAECSGSGKVYDVSGDGPWTCYACANTSEVVGYANGDELDNMLDDRTAVLSPVKTGFHTVPVYRRARAALAQPSPAPELPRLKVMFLPMPESNGKSNFTAILMRDGGDICDGFTLSRSEYPDRVRYQADCVRWLIGELPEKPFILDYDADKHSGYKASVAQAEQVPEIHVRKLGTYGKAYDLPETKRAYTYAEQPDNLGASRLGDAATATITATAGDHIDRGLVLLRELQAKGFGVFELSAAPAQGGE